MQSNITVENIKIGYQVIEKLFNRFEQEDKFNPNKN